MTTTNHNDPKENPAMTITTSPVSAQELQRELATLQAETRFVILPPLQPLNDAVARWSARSQINPNLKGELSVALHQQEQAENAHAEHATRLARIEQITAQLADIDQQDRMHNIQQANAALDEARNNYMYAGRLLVKAYRELLNQSRRNGHIPGARTAIPQGFDFGPANPAGWTGNTSEMMRQGLLPVEQRESEKAA